MDVVTVIVRWAELIFRRSRRAYYIFSTARECSFNSFTIDRSFIQK